MNYIITHLSKPVIGHTMSTAICQDLKKIGESNTRERVPKLRKSYSPTKITLDVFTTSILRHTDIVVLTYYVNH